MTTTCEEAIVDQAPLRDIAAANDVARQRLVQRAGEPLFICRWVDVVMLHYKVVPAALRDLVPFELDLFRGSAYVSAVAFTLRGMRPRLGGRLGAWLCAPLATERFLNLRTYVRCDDEPGIYFLAEWVSKRLNSLLGPRIYGLPYRLGQLNYDHDPFQSEMRGSVTAADGSASLAYRARLDPGAETSTCVAGTLAAFLLERYTAFTHRGRIRRRFDVWHRPWSCRAVEGHIEHDSLLRTTGRWFESARLLGGHYSPGFDEVWMGRPRTVRRR